MEKRQEVYALVFAYLLKVDVDLAKKYKKLTKAERLDERAPSLEEVVRCFLRAKSQKSHSSWTVHQSGSPKERSARSISTLAPAGKVVKSFKEPKRCTSRPEPKQDYKIAQANFKALSGGYKRPVKELYSGAAAKSEHARNSKCSDPTWTPRPSRPLRVAPASRPDSSDTDSDSSDTDSDSGLDDACSVFSSVSSRASTGVRLRPQPCEDLPSAPGDRWLRCDQCGRLWQDGHCLLHGPAIAVPDSDVPADTPPRERAARSVPGVLRVGPSGVHRGGLGVWARRPLPAGLRFGPYRGRRETSRSRASEGGCSWEVHRGGALWFCVDAADPARSNWMRYVNCAPSAEEENVTAYQHRWRIFYRTCRPIKRDTELLVYYGDEYGKELAREAAGKRRR